jgi:ribosomal protein S18 acetylase RimI-like enzyme
MAAMEGVTITRYDEKFARDFGTLNYEWIAKGYSIEKHDREVLDHPEAIIAQGGEIFFAVVDDKAVGTVALIPMDQKALELTKMAVSPGSRGLGIGDKLMDACIDWGREQGKRSLILESNTKQVAAIALYRKFGFVEIPLDPNTEYERANIRMEKILEQERT